MTVTPVTTSQLRTAFVNLTKGEASRLTLPTDLADQPWEDLDYLGWRDPKAPLRAYLVTPYDDRLRGVALRLPQDRGPRKTMCSLCLTVGDVSLMVAPRAGRAGQASNSVGTYICTDLGCSLYVRNKRKAATSIINETLTVEQKVERLVTNVHAFVGRVLRPT